MLKAGGSASSSVDSVSRILRFGRKLSRWPGAQQPPYRPYCNPPPHPPNPVGPRFHAEGSLRHFSKTCNSFVNLGFGSAVGSTGSVDVMIFELEILRCRKDIRKMIESFQSKDLDDYETLPRPNPELLKSRQLCEILGIFGRLQMCATHLGCGEDLLFTKRVKLIPQGFYPLIYQTPPTQKKTLQEKTFGLATCLILLLFFLSSPNHTQKRPSHLLQEFRM